MTRRVAITGATGFLGLALAERLRSGGDDVTGLVRRSSQAGVVEVLERLGVRRVEGDVTDAASLTALVEGADLVVHSAAVIGYRRKLAAAMRSVNVGGAANVAAASRAAGVGRLVHVSSIAGVGITDTPVLQTEASPWLAAPLRVPYFDTKHAAEERIQAEVAAGLDAVIVNPAAIYGPSVAPSNSNQLVARVAVGRLRFAPAGGINVVPLSTVVDGVLAAARKGRTGRRYVLGGENLDLSELFMRIGRAAGRRLTPRVLPGWLGPPLRLAMDAVEPCIPRRVWYTPDLCAAFGRWMWFDTARMRDELDVDAADLDACLEQTVAQLRRDGRLPR
ncbi:MAG: NAD-dependent epimerase/dehydratase family protein [Planctomycetota bacterium]|jgi:dihydroflavonol-4-reductase